MEEDGDVVTRVALVEEVAVCVTMYASFEEFGGTPTGENAVDARHCGDGVVNCMPAGVSVRIEFNEVRESVIDSLAGGVAVGSGSRCRNV